MSIKKLENPPVVNLSNCPKKNPLFSHERPFDETSTQSALRKPIPTGLNWDYLDGYDSLVAGAGGLEPP